MCLFARSQFVYFCHSQIKKRSDKHGEKRIMSKRVNKLKGGNMTKKLKLGNLNELMWREFK